jgi:hypothetical protein
LFCAGYDVNTHILAGSVRPSRIRALAHTGNAE